MATKTDTEQERADFEAWANGRCELHLVNPAGRYSSATTQFAWEAYQAGRAALQSQDAEDAVLAEWMTDDGRAPWARNSLKDRIKEMRASEKRCRNAFRKDYMRVVSVYFADALGEAAEALEKRLSVIDYARRVEGE